MRPSSLVRIRVGNLSDRVGNIPLYRSDRQFSVLESSQDRSGILNAGFCQAWVDPDRLLQCSELRTFATDCAFVWSKRSSKRTSVCRPSVGPVAKETFPRHQPTKPGIHGVPFLGLHSHSHSHSIRIAKYRGAPIVKQLHL